MQAACSICGTGPSVYARGLCRPCYLRSYHRVIRACAACGARGSGHRSGLCRPCFYDSPLALAPSLRRLEAAGYKWACRLVQRFRRHAAGHGYCGTIAVSYSRILARQISDSPARNVRAFAAWVAKTHADMLLGGAKHVGQPRAVVHFLEDAKLISREDWDDLALEGRTRSLLAGAPAAFRPDLEAFQASLDDERQYRRATGEPSRQRGTEHALFVVLVSYARWLDSRGLTSWQQLTPDRFRVAVRNYGPATPRGTVIDHIGRLKRLFAFLHEERRIFRNPLAPLRRPGKPEMRGRLIAAPELRSVVRVISDTRIDPLPRFIGALVALHGLTTAEIVALRVGDYEPRTRRMRLQRRGITLPLDPVTHAALAEYLGTRHEARDNPFLFVTNRTRKDGRPATDGFVGHQLNRLGIRRPYAFRMTLLRDVLLRENSVVAQRLFGMSRRQIDRHLCRVGAEKLWQFQLVGERVQDSL